MNGQDAERRLHWLRLAQELGQEDDFRALLDDIRDTAVAEIYQALKAHRDQAHDDREPGWPLLTEAMVIAGDKRRDPSRPL